ncbi:NRAMP family divalent metal transporter [Sphingomonas pruni]|uniref:NRAMP family divalent metal transporter n=1 Tax=Sphingomonas pruni TaxID=40683 RepID=UPI001FE0599B|nr:divalent metal cation transporter [Sphingomonas pruni]
MTEPSPQPAVPASPSIDNRAKSLDRLKRHPLARVGPGLITGVADDDPSGIATYSQAGAAYGLGMLWTMPVAYPLMSAIQILAARLGRVTGKGLAANMRLAFPGWVVTTLVILLLVANTLNIAADIAAMGETAELVGGVSRHVMIALFVAVTLLLQIFVPYHRYVFFLKWLTLSLLAYAAVLFAVHVPWGETLRQTVLPHFRLDGAAATMIVAIFGTTISPYLLFWQASEEIEDMRGAPSLRDDPSAASAELSRIGWDTWSGMLYSNLASYFIILATGVTLHAAGITQIDTAAEAAAALRPLAGAEASIIFAAGILGVGFIGVPVLAGSAGYALCEAMGWEWGLDRKATDARAFYAIIAISVLLALVLQFLPISPMRALFWSAVINGVVAIPLIVVLMILASRSTVMGAFTASRPLIWLAGVAAGLMGVAAVVMVAGFF